MMKREKTVTVPPPPPTLTAARWVCEHHAVLATSRTSFTVDLISRFLDVPVSQVSVSRAAMLGSIALLERLVYQARSIQATDEFLLEHWLTKAARTAATYGHAQVVRYLLAYSSDRVPSYFVGCAEAVMDGAMEAGRLAILQETAEAIGIDHAHSCLGALSVPIACVDVMQWLQSIHVHPTLLFVLSSTRSEDDTLRGVQELWSNEDTRVDVMQSLLPSAVSRDFDRVVRYLVEDVGVKVAWSVVSSCGRSSGYPGRMLQYLLDHVDNSRTGPLCDALERFLEASALVNAELVLSYRPELWLQVEQDDPPVLARSLLQFAVATGSRHVLRWVLAYHRKHHSTAKRLRTPKTMIQAAARHGHLAMVLWLHNHSRTDWDGSWPGQSDGDGESYDKMERLEGYSGKACENEADDAIYRGHLVVVQWLWANRPAGFSERSLEFAILGGHLPVVQFLHVNVREITKEMALWKIVDTARAGHLEVVMWLHHIAGKGKICPPKAMLFQNPIDLAVAKWVYVNAVVPRDNVAMGWISFPIYICDLVACGRLAVIEWFFEIGQLMPGSMERVWYIVDRGDLYTLQWLAARVPQLVDWNVVQQYADEKDQDHIVAWLETIVQDP